MKMPTTYVIALILLLFIQSSAASQVVPPRLVVRFLIQSLQEERTHGVDFNFGFDVTRHHHLTSLSKDEQLQILKALPLDDLKFEQDEYTIDTEERFVVKLLSPVRLDIEMERLKHRGEIGPPWRYRVIALRRVISRPAR